MFTKLKSRNLTRKRHLRSSGCRPGFEFNCTRNQAAAGILVVINIGRQSGRSCFLSDLQG